MRHLTRAARLLPLLALTLVASCDRARSLVGLPGTATPHERYAASLREAELDSTALGTGWLRAAAAALADPVGAELPLLETGYFAADKAGAVGYAFSAERGRRLTARLEVQGSPPPRIFFDLFRMADGAAPEHLESADGDSLAWEAADGLTYLLRLQPELLRSVRYTLTVRDDPALAFPVSGRDSRAIRSFFGAERDSGRRSHHGVDFFAPRCTAAVAAADGIFSRVGITPRGGRVVWVRDPRRAANLYYAHLDSQTVSPGTPVRAGDTIGLVGNTGNASTTPPHLHFGIYVSGRGPVDPLPWVQARKEPAPVTADTALLGGYVRSRGALGLRASPTGRAPADRVLPNASIVRAVGASGRWYRVATDDGGSGYLRASDLRAAATPLRRERLAAETPLRDRADPAAAVVATLPSGSRVAVLGRSRGFLLVRPTEGVPGWIAEPS
ncbi:hypothetical protein BH20GEM2_BH20GEM2_01070 [soil metagenome]